LSDLIFFLNRRFIFAGTYRSANSLTRVEHGIFRPTLPEDSMSTKQLEYAALSPPHFVDNYVAVCLLSLSYHCLLGSSLSGGRISDIPWFNLIPGGLLLITVMTTGLIQLWDLSFIPNAAIDSD
jgi:hypothetical protein